MQLHLPILAATLLVCLMAGGARAQQPTWRATGPLDTSRFQHTETLLPNGKVLISGGFLACRPNCIATSSAEIYDPATGAWSATASMAMPRADHVSVLLPSGKVLVAGGYNAAGQALRESELFDPDTRTWSATGSLSVARQSHQAVLLADGKVLIVGRVAGSPQGSSAELYDPSTGAWSPGGTISSIDFSHTATLLLNGKALVTGPSRRVELYDPATRSWTLTGELISARARYTATLLPNGKVLVAGGMPDEDTVLDKAELYDPDTGQWTATGSMTVPHVDHTATLLPNGKVLVAGGLGVTGACELYDPASGSWTATAGLRGERAVHSATLLNDGRVLVAGGLTGLIGREAGLPSAELFGAGAQPDGVVVTVSAASFADNSSVAPESIASAFGSNLAASTQAASAVPLPTTLGGVSVKVKDSAGVDRLASLFFVSPGQINYQIPPGTSNGPATVTVTRGANSVATGVVSIAWIAPGLFSANGNGRGVAAAGALRVRADGSQSYESVARFDSAQNRFVAAPVDLGPETDQVFLVLFGGGIRFRAALSAVTASVGGTASEVLFAGPSPELVGVDQINLRLSRSLVGRGEVDIALAVEKKAANLVRLSIR